MFQAKLQGWRRLAAGLALVPGLTGVGIGALGLQGRVLAEDKPAAVVKADEARDLMRQAREAYDAKNYGKAKELAEKARSLRAPSQFFDDTPEDLLADIAKKSGAKPGGAAKPTITDPRRLMGMAKQSLESGDLDKAQDYASMAQANEGSVRWGLFDDTPSSLLKDIQKAKTKRDQHQADKLLADAKALLERQAADKRERLSNLMMAEEKARQAGKLHGPYSVWDFGDRPEEIIADSRKIRDKEKLTGIKPVDTKPSNSKVGDTQTADARNPKKPVSESGKTPATTDGKTPYSEVARDPKATANVTQKAEVIALMKEATALKMQGNYPAAREKLILASKANVSFSKEEDSPVTELNRLNGLAQRKINTLCAEAKSSVARKDTETANTKLEQANKLALAMNLDVGPVQEVMASMNPVKPAPTKVVNGSGTSAKPATNDVAVGIVAPPVSSIPSVMPDNSAPSIRTVAGLDKGPGVIPAVVPPTVTPPADVAPAVATNIASPIGDPALTPAPVAVPVPRMAPIPGETVKVSQTPEIKTPAFVNEPAKTPSTTVQAPLPPVGPTPAMLNEAANVSAPPSMVVQEPLPTVRSTAPGADARGREMLNQARTELRKDNADGARKLVIEVINGPYSCKEEATGLLNSIEAEESARKLNNARRAFENGMAAFNANNYTSALAIFQQIEPMQLNAKNRAQLSEFMSAAAARQKAAIQENALVQAGGTDVKPGLPPRQVPQATPSELPGSVPTPRIGADNLLKQQEALSQVEFQQLRSQGLKVETEATARFGKGETDAALQDLQNFVSKVRATSLDVGKQNLLVRPIEARMERLKILKHQTDFLTKERSDRTGIKAEMTQEALFRQKNQEEVARLMKSSSKLVAEHKYSEAYAQVQKAQAIDSDDPSVNASLQIIKTMMRKKEFDRVKSTQEEDNFTQLNELMEHPLVNNKDPLKFSTDKDTRERILNRPDYSRGIGIMRSRTDSEKAIERKLGTPVSVSFNAMPLESVVEHLQTVTGINFDLDTRGLKEGNIDSKQTITAKLNNVSLKSALNIICQQAGLKHVIENETIRVTTPKNAAGRQVVRSVPVGDLVIPAPNFGADPGLSLPEALQRAIPGNSGSMSGPGASMRNGRNALPPGTSVSDSGLPGLGGRLMNQPIHGGAGSSQVTGGTLERELIRLITTTIKPDSWMQQGGEGTIEYYPLGLAMVINQSPEVIEEVERLLESLRKLQDLEVSIEVKVVALGETFYERIGVDFAMGIRTNASPIASGPGTVVGAPNNQSFSGNVVGLQTPGVPTPDLNIPIRATSFSKAVPPFGGFTNSFADGGLSLGLAFLSDIQVQMFLEAAQGDTRTNVLQAPKITSLNGTAAIISVNDFQFFLTGMQVTSVAGQLVFTPQNIPFPVGTSTQTPTSPLNPTPSLTSNLPGITLSVQPVVSADRRFVRMNIQQSFINLISGTAQVPITTIITPVFENGGQGQPTPFTQFLQQPRFSSIDTQTVVVVPDGGTVVMGGLKYMSEGRNEYGPPVLSKIPYLNRLFKNVAYGREGRSILLMVTPRIIINREEQLRQTGVSSDDDNN
ncbi:hypothetical protein [Zavarzinella formosa]|uniref:hypothetical protein n=1 Tax=Zavarzinella formosa TaxID=360055 RepID=UPI0002F4EEDC|nr:hypothetical protein [Zavarzinella formosa]